jgi:hypothetical protein
MTDRMTLESLTGTAAGLDQARRGRYGDGQRTATERGGMGLFEVSMAGHSGFELVYGTGGHGGPYKSEALAKNAAERLLKGQKSEQWIAVISAKDTTNLTKAKALWLLKRDGDWVKGPQPLPNVAPHAHYFESASAPAVLSEAKREAKIPALPPGWSARNKNEAQWTSKNGEHYRIENWSHRGWIIHYFKPGARTGEQLKVSDIDAKLKSKMVPGLKASEWAIFVHGFDAAEAAMDHDKAHPKSESANEEPETESFLRLREALATAIQLGLKGVKMGRGKPAPEQPIKKKTRADAEREYQQSAAYRTADTGRHGKKGYYPQSMPAGMKLPAFPNQFSAYAKAMPDKDLDKNAGYRHPAVKALKKKLLADMKSNALSVDEFDKQYIASHEAMFGFTDKMMGAKTDAERDPFRFAARKMMHVWRAYHGIAQDAQMRGSQPGVRPTYYSTMARARQ